MKFITTDSFRFNAEAIYPIVGLAKVDEKGIIEVPEEKAGEFAKFNKSFSPFADSEANEVDTFNKVQEVDLTKQQTFDITGSDLNQGEVSSTSNEEKKSQEDDSQKEDEKKEERLGLTPTEEEAGINFEEWKVEDLKAYAKDEGLKNYPSKKEELIQFLRASM